MATHEFDECELTAAQAKKRAKKLISDRDGLKNNINRYKNFIDNNAENIDIVQLKFRTEELENDFKIFKKIQSSIEYLESEDLSAQYQIREEYEETYYIYTAKAERLLHNQEYVNNYNTPLNTLRANENDINVKLPTIYLPKFSGSESETWTSFSASFRTSVHDNPSFRNSQKLMYLRTCLSGKAAEKIESLEISDVNYKVAWEILEKNYYDPKTLINKRIKSLFELPQCTKANVTTISNLLDEATKHYRALEALNKPFLEAFPIYAVTSKLDEQTREKWREHIQGTEIPKMTDLLDFLHNRKKIIETSRSEKRDEPQNSPHSRNSFRRKFDHNKENKASLVYSTQLKEILCQLCRGQHYTQSCEKLLKATVSERVQIVKNAKLCLNCLRANHFIDNCKSNSRCKTCKNMHHSLLHQEHNENKSFTGVSATAPSQVLLSTAIVHLVDKNGLPHACRALLDSGAQSNFLTAQVASKLGLEQKSVDIPITGISQTETHVFNSMDIKLRSVINKYSSDLTFLILPKITDRLPIVPLSKKLLNIPSNVTLADPDFHKPGEIDIILGAEIFFKLLCVGQINVAPPSMVLQKTLLGWVISGKTFCANPNKKLTCNFIMDSLHMEVAKFWEIEEGPTNKLLSLEEQKCEDHFIQNVKRSEETGKYTVKLPFNHNKAKLGISYTNALNRFYSLEKSLDKNPQHKEQYRQFLKEYEELGHMSECRNNEQDGFFMPHHAVFKQSSLTTKLRVVFDGSAKSSSGISLNDTLMVGPTIQDDLFSIVLRFRMYPFVLTADIEKMYRQINVHTEDRNYQKILWRDSKFENLKTYKLNTVTYGTASASFLATRSLKQLALDESKGCPIASTILMEDFYIDDLLTGARTIDEALQIRNDLIKITKAGGLNLRQWASNEPNLIKQMHDKLNKSYICLDTDETIKTLGICWNAQQDSIIYTLNLEESNNRITKRSILSNIARLFDPLGLLGPIIVKAKIIMQRLWQLKLNWDESVPHEMHLSWSTFNSELSLLKNISIRRKAVIKSYLSIQIHGFCDASEKAYGACLFVRSVDEDGMTYTQLLCSKSRVAPLKSITIPRLELSAATLLANLADTAARSLKRIPIEKIILWSDSTIVLHWINTPPHTLKTFVGNRVSEIQRLSNNYKWFHVRSEDNPADMLSRGSMPSEFCNDNKIWQTGPTWLQLPENMWPVKELETIIVTEKRQVPDINCLTINTNSESTIKLFNKYSSFITLKRVIAYCLRFINNCKIKRKPNNNLNKRDNSNRNTSLSTEDLQVALKSIVKLVQNSAFALEIKALRSDRQVTGRLSPLCPFVDSDNILRVGGRLRLSDLPYSQKHPILLPAHHRLTTLIIEHEHKKHFHAGTQATLNAIRQQFWIINGRNAVRTVIHKCITCFRSKPSISNYIMGDLPKNRTTYKRPFLHTGTDFCGPFFIKEKRHRNQNKLKVYICIFVCFATKAVHIEIVQDLTTEAFIACLKRFISRRGKPTDIYSDNATNFCGAKREIDSLYRFLINNKSKIDHTLSNDNIKWHFIPPRSPHFGGLWEAAVKSCKHHLLRVAGNTLLSYEVLNTFIIEIEAILNSRPLLPLSSDPNDFQALTPAHFLIGDSLTSMPEQDLQEIPSGRLSSWQHAQQLKQHFWTRWRKEYLHQQNVRAKWHSIFKGQLEIGTVVILHEDSVPPIHWKLGRIIQTHPGQDGTIRVVTVKTSSGEYKRSIKKLSPLPVTEETNEN